MIFSKKQYILYILFFTIAICISYFYVDKVIAKYFIENKDFYESIGKFISIFGESHWYIATAILGLVFFKTYKKNTLYANRFLFLLYVNLFSGILSVILKSFFGRMRPWGLKNDGDSFGFLLFQNFDLGFIGKIQYHLNTLIDASTVYASFPSGHTTTIFAVFTYLSILLPKYLWLWLSIAVVLASSRLLANDHFLSDIFAGILLGTVSTMYIYSKMREKI